MKKIIKPVCLFLGLLFLLVSFAGCPKTPNTEDETILLSDISDYVIEDALHRIAPEKQGQISRRRG